MTDLVVVLTQRRCIGFSQEATDGFWFRGGCTLLIDTGAVGSGCAIGIAKSIVSAPRSERQRSFMMRSSAETLSGLYFGSDGKEPFAMLHRGF